MVFTLCATFASLSLLVHGASALMAHKKPGSGGLKAKPPVSILMPLCGEDPFTRCVLNALFDLDWPQLEVILCVADSRDPVVDLARAAIAAHPRVSARLILGDVKISANPKLNNLAHGWYAAAHGWIVMVDSNVLLPRDRLSDLFAAWGGDTGLVCSPPQGSHAFNLGAEIECAFLNSHGLRWQFAVDCAGVGYAQGKTMLWRRELIDEAGGLYLLGAEAAEDAAATKLVRAQGLRVSLARPAAKQPLGHRALGDVWTRQVRWARLRRVTFPIAYAAEILTTPLWAMIACAIAAAQIDAPAPLAATLAAMIWYGIEDVLSRAMGWSWTLRGALVRDLLIPALWASGWAGSRFTWRGTAMDAIRS